MGTGIVFKMSLLAFTGKGFDKPNNGTGVYSLSDSDPEKFSNSIRSIFYRRHISLCRQSFSNEPQHVRWYAVSNDKQS